MKAAVCREFGKPLVIEEVKLLPPKAGEVQSPGPSLLSPQRGSMVDFWAQHWMRSLSVKDIYSSPMKHITLPDTF